METTGKGFAMDILHQMPDEDDGRKLLRMLHAKAHCSAECWGSWAAACEWSRWAGAGWEGEEGHNRASLQVASSLSSNKNSAQQLSSDTQGV